MCGLCSGIASDSSSLELGDGRLSAGPYNASFKILKIIIYFSDLMDGDLSLFLSFGLSSGNSVSLGVIC